MPFYGVDLVATGIRALRTGNEFRAFDRFLVEDIVRERRGLAADLGAVFLKCRHRKGILFIGVPHHHFIPGEERLLADADEGGGGGEPPYTIPFRS